MDSSVTESKNSSYRCSLAHLSGFPFSLWTNHENALYIASKLNNVFYFPMERKQCQEEVQNYGIIKIKESDGNHRHGFVCSRVVHSPILAPKSTPFDLFKI